MPETFDFEAELWLYPGKAGWVFVTLPEEVADRILGTAPARRGFGSIKVEVTAGTTTWSTSIFPDSKAGSFLLPVKRAVREAEGVDVGDVVGLTLTPLL